MFGNELTSICNPLGHRKEYYCSFGRIIRVTNEAGGNTHLTYDEKGNVNTITDPDGVVTEYKYDELNRVIESSVVGTGKTRFEYDNDDRITKTIDALENTREYFYDAMGIVTSVKEPDGTIRSYERNIMGRVSKITDEAGRVTEITYNAMGKQEKVCLPNGGVILYEYDPLMRITKITDPEGRSQSFDYDPNGNVIAEYLGDIKVRSLEYDVLNRVTKEVDALGHEKTYVYDAAGNVTEVIDALGNKYVRDYDLLGRIIKETDPLGNSTTYAYTKLGAIESVTDAVGRVRRFEYTDGGKLKAIYFCEKLEQELVYDKAGRIEKRSFADGYAINYIYDVLSRVSKVEGSDDRTVSYQYDAMGRATKVVDGNSTTLYTYTPTGRLKSVVDALGNETAYTYDALDNLKSIQRAEGRIENEDNYLPKVGEDGHVTIYDYNLAGQLTTVTDALGQQEHYSYDQYGRLVNKKDRDSFDTRYEYNNLGAVTKVGYADGKSVELSYDALGRLNQFKDWLGTTYIERDVLGRATAVTDFNGRKVSYTYGKINERTSIIYPDGKKVDYIYDDFLRLKELVDGTTSTAYIYDEFNRLSKKNLPNGNTQEFNYLPGGYLKSLEMFDSSGLIDKYIYDYDNQGNRTEIERFRRDLNDISGKYTYEYDLENRLTDVSLNGAPLRKYEYDAFGNRSALIEKDNKTTYSYDELDRLLEEVSAVEKKSYSYDNRGNIASTTVNGVLEKTFTFDTRNLLSHVSDVNKGEADYSYNAMGKRVAVTRPEEKIEYLLDLAKDYHNMLERSVNGEIESYVYDSNVVSMSKQGEDYFYMLDELGTGMYLTGTDGAEVSSFAYDEFGRNLNPVTGKLEKLNYTKQGNIIQPLAFTGYQHDELTGSYFAQARYYNATAGRFVSEDKVRGYLNRPDSINHYLYCWNRPISLRDLDGRDVIDDEFYGYQEHIDGTAEMLESSGKVFMNIATTIDEGDHPIIVLGVSGSVGLGINATKGVQIVYDPIKDITDPLHMIGVQKVTGAGFQSSGNVGASFYEGILIADNMNWLERFGTEVGFDGGEFGILGLGGWMTGEPYVPERRYGLFASCGVGGELTGVNSHVTISHTSDTFYPYEYVYNAVRSMFKGEKTECVQEKQKY